MSHSPVTSSPDLFTASGNGYSWYSVDNSKAGTYTVTVTATEDGCNISATDTYTVDVLVNCENLTVDPPASISTIVYEVTNTGSEIATYGGFGWAHSSCATTIEYTIVPTPNDSSAI